MLNWRRAVTGDLEDVYRRSRPRLVRLATLLVDDVPTAEDLVQDLFASLATRGVETITDGYLAAAVINRSKSVLRHRRVARRGIARLAARRPEATDCLAEMESALAPVWVAVTRLPLRQRQVVVCRFWLDLSEHETAGLLGVSEGTVKKCSARARATLIQVLKEHQHA